MEVRSQEFFQYVLFQNLISICVCENILLVNLHIIMFINYIYYSSFSWRFLFFIIKIFLLNSIPSDFRSLFSYWSSHGRRSVKKGALKNFASFTVKHLRLSLILRKSCRPLFLKLSQNETSNVFLWNLPDF